MSANEREDERTRERMKRAGCSSSGRQEEGVPALSRARREFASGGAGRRPPLEDFGRHPPGGEPHSPGGPWRSSSYMDFEIPMGTWARGVAWATPWRIFPSRDGK